MRAFRVLDWGRRPELVEMAVPEPGRGQVRVRVAGCGLCHSDIVMGQLEAAMGEAIGWKVPFTLGHETAGWIDAIGPDVSFAEGAAVALVSPSSCGTCRWCVRGQDNACPNGLVGRGYGRDGGLADFVLVDSPERSLVALGGFDPRIAGPLTDAGATSYHAVRGVLAHLSDDSTVVVIGVGGLGSFVVQFLRAMTTARIIAVDQNEHRRVLASELGAHHVVEGVGADSKRATHEAMAAVVGRDPVDAVIDLVGSDDTISVGAGVLAAGGALALVGAAGGKLLRPWFSGLPRDGRVFTFQGSDRADAHAVIDLAEQGLIRVDVDSYRLDRVCDAYAALDAGTLHGRAVVQP